MINRLLKVYFTHETVSILQTNKHKEKVERKIQIKLQSVCKTKEKN